MSNEDFNNPSALVRGAINEHFTREEAVALAAEWGRASTEFRTDDGTPYQKVTLSQDRLKAMLEAAVSAKLAGWRKQESVAMLRTKGLVRAFATEAGYELPDGDYPLYAHPRPAQPVNVGLVRASITDAPAVLNLNDKAMWVLGYNDALSRAQAIPAQPTIPPELLTDQGVHLAMVRGQIAKISMLQCAHSHGETAVAEYRALTESIVPPMNSEDPS